MPSAAPRRMPVRDQDHIVVLRGGAWSDYARLRELRGDRSAPRIAFLEGAIEIMSPSRSHEGIKARIASLLEAYCLERGIEFDGYGSWTLEDQALERGVEPDACYVIGERRDPARPDLAIEVVWSSGGIDKLEIYRKLKVREVWYWRRGSLVAYVLRRGRYVASAESVVVPGVDLAELASFLERPTTSAAIRAYRRALRAPR